MAGFEELLEITTEGSGGLHDGRATVTRMRVSASHLNTSGICLGGYMASAAIASAARCAGEGLRLLNTDYRYLRPSPEDALVKAHSSVLKEGRFLTVVETRVFSDDALAGIAFSEFARGAVDTALVEGGGVSSLICGQEACALPTPDLFFTGDIGETALLSDEDLRRVLACTDRRFVAPLNPRRDFTHAALRTDARLADGDFVHPGVIALLADNTLGSAAFAVLGRPTSAVTTSLKVDCAQQIPVGETISCTANLAMRAGQVITLSGEIWAQGGMVGTCSGNFFALQS